MNNKVLLNNYIFSVCGIIEKLGNEFFSKHGLTVKTYTILLCIEKGFKKSSDLARVVSGSPASITQKTKALEKNGLISRIVDIKDKRIWVFQLTEKGRIILERVLPDYEKSIEDIFGKFSDDEIEKTLHMFTKMKEYLLNKLNIENINCKLDQ